jgi:hypothetical protein
MAVSDVLPLQSLNLLLALSACSAALLRELNDSIFEVS